LREATGWCRRQADIADRGAGQGSVERVVIHLSARAALILVTAGGFHLSVSAADFGP
jgi:hypothetical protein